MLLLSVIVFFPAVVWLFLLRRKEYQWNFALFRILCDSFFLLIALSGLRLLRLRQSIYNDVRGKKNLSL